MTALPDLEATSEDQLKKELLALFNDYVDMKSKYESLLLDTSFKDIRAFLDETPAPTRHELFILQRRVENLTKEMAISHKPWEE